MGVEAVNCVPVSSCDQMAQRKSRDIFAPAIIGVAVACLSMPIAACARSNASQPTTARAVSDWVAGAKPGDRILLAAGDYGSLKLKHRVFLSPGVLIQAAPGAKVTFSSIVIDGSQGLTIKGVDVNVAASNFGVTVSHSSRITLAGLKIHAPRDASPSPNAIMLRYARDVIVEDCQIQDVAFGISFADSDHLKILRNDIADLKVDAIRGSASYVDVIGNHAENFRPEQGDHPDFIQFWGAGVAVPNKELTIRDNVYERGSGVGVQGIFLEDIDGVVISGNALLGTMYNAVSLARVHGALIENNFVQSYPDMGARIVARGESADVIVRNNIAPAILSYAENGKPNPGYLEEHNQTIGVAKQGDTSGLRAWLAKRPAPQPD